MEFEEFHERANALSMARYGIEIKEDKLRDWIREYKLRANPNSHAWNEAELERVLLVSEIRSRGINSENETLVNLWLRDIQVPIERLRVAVLAEAVRLRHKVLKPINSSYDARVGNPTTRNINAIVRKAGNRSEEILGSDFKYPDEAIVDVYGLMKFGKCAKLSSDLRDHFPEFRSVSAKLNEAGITIPDPKDLFAGVFGEAGTQENPGEIADAAENSVAQASEEVFLSAREIHKALLHGLDIAAKNAADIPEIVQSFLRQLKMTPLELIGLFKQPNWAVGLFVMYVHWTFRQSSKADFEAK